MAKLVSIAKIMQYNRAVQVAALHAIASLCRPSERERHNASPRKHCHSKVPHTVLATNRKPPMESVAQQAQKEFNCVSGIDVLLSLINVSLIDDYRSTRSIILDTDPLDLFLACLMVVSVGLSPSDARVVVSKCGGLAFLTEAAAAAIRRNNGKTGLDSATEDLYRWLRVVGSRRKNYAGEDAMVSNAQLITFLTINS